MDTTKGIIYVAYAALAAVVAYVIYNLTSYAKERMDSPFKYFSWSEFDTGATQADRDAGVDTYFSPLHGNHRVTGSGQQHMNADFIRLLDKIREDAGFPFIITSGYRSPAWNTQVGGSANSSHMQGIAVDIRVLNDGQRHALVKAALKHGVNRFGWGRNYVHIDVDRTKRPQTVWGYAGGPTPPDFSDLHLLA